MLIDFLSDLNINGCDKLYIASPRDLRLQAVAAQALAGTLSARARRLFEGMAEHDRQSATRTIRYAEDTLGPL